MKQVYVMGFDPGVDITNTLADAVAHGTGMMQVTATGLHHIEFERLNNLG